MARGSGHAFKAIEIFVMQQKLLAQYEYWKSFKSSRNYTIVKCLGCHLGYREVGLNNSNHLHAEALCFVNNNGKEWASHFWKYYVFNTFEELLIFVDQLVFPVFV